MATLSVTQWKDADVELQPTVASVKKRLTELRGMEGKQEPRSESEVPDFALATPSLRSG
ncbi:MAG: hypothetical protein IPN47_27930 [Gemmatimonadetes bacterium]|nr:hypothetical protein [Gemmatimonadota bacterium]